MRFLNKFAVGDTVQFDTQSNLGICQDVIRDLFIQRDTLGNEYPAAVLTNHSWTALENCTLVERSPALPFGLTEGDFQWKR